MLSDTKEITRRSKSMNSQCIDKTVIKAKKRKYYPQKKTKKN